MDCDILRVDRQGPQILQVSAENSPVLDDPGYAATAFPRPYYPGQRA
jgi:hypothetical protein